MDAGEKIAEDLAVLPLRMARFASKINFFTRSCPRFPISPQLAMRTES
jgi:hypothetical protein